MLTANLLAKKRDGFELTDDEIRYLIDGFCREQVADYQMSALAMAICLRGMTPREVATLTEAMLASGDRLPRSGDRPRVDKHSTGGLGDKVSLILAPLLASCDVEVPMISGRGLGRTGGTLDKLEAIPGLRTDLPVEATEPLLRKTGAFIVGASERIAPADRRLYALRDVTGTVESVPLITASILSKKLAANLDALVMDVKVGSAAFMKTLSEAEALAESLIRVGGQSGLPTVALLTDMDQPLGEAVGNAIEVNESLDVLRGGGPSEVRTLTVELAAEVLVQVGVADDWDQARRRLAAHLDGGQAMERFESMVGGQGGRLDGPLRLAPAHRVTARREGYVAAIDSVRIGDAVLAMGGGRRRVGDSIDPSVGIAVHVRVGDSVSPDQPLLTVHCPPERSAEIVAGVRDAVQLVPKVVPARPLILRRMRPSEANVLAEESAAKSSPKPD